MKIKVEKLSYEQAKDIPAPKHRLPQKPIMPLRALLKILSAGELKDCGFSSESIDMERLSPDEPCLILMNHSAFIDLKIASSIFYPRPLSIVCTSDGFVGKEKFMRAIGCIPTQKFVFDVSLVKALNYSLKVLKSSVLMYPEASYSFDGTATDLPRSLGKLIRLFKVPVVSVITKGAFLHDPLYNGLKLRKVKVSAQVRYLFGADECESLSADQINERLKEVFSFDNFELQMKEQIKIDAPFRAEGLNRVLYKCPHCNKEGEMHSEGIRLWCDSCGAEYTLSEYGELIAENVTAAFSSVPQWYAWERSEAKKLVERDDYRESMEVKILMLRDFKSIYEVGTGTLTHDKTGFTLKGDDGLIDYHQAALSSYSLYSDYFWYEIGDMVCIGDNKTLYYCFPQNRRDVVAKMRLLTEELYKLLQSRL